MAARKPRGGSTTVRVNFKDVESRRTPPEGDYVLAVLEAKSSTSGAGNEQIEFIMEISRGEYKGTKLWFYCPTTESSLWKLHAWLTALGEDVPEDDMDIDLPELVGKELVGVLTHETYQGKKKAKITDFSSIKEYSGDLPGDDKGGKKKKKDKDGKKKKEEPAEKSSKKDKAEPEAKGKKDKGKKVEPEAKSDKKDKAGKGKKDKTPKIDADDVKALDVKGLKKLIKEHSLDVDLDDFKTLKKQAAAVCDELESKDLLAD